MGDKDKCTICLEEIGENDCVKTKCGHRFHFSCLYKNIKKNRSSGDKCPLCREVYIKPPPRRPPPRYTIFSSRRHFYRSSFRRVNVVNNGINNNIRLRVPYSYTQQGDNSLPRVSIESIKRYIDALSFEELKTELKNHNLSSRGYRRVTLEKRLKRHLTRINFAE